MTVRELLSRIDSRELAEWVAFYSMEPWGTDIDDWRAGIVAATIANVNRDEKKRRKPYTPQDFIPEWDRQPETKTQTPEEQAHALGLWGRVWEERFGDET